jgi:stage III sporulation protein AG
MQNQSNAEYIRLTEEKLADIVGSVAGVGRVKIMLTLEQGPRYLYAQEGKTQQDRTEDVLASGQRKVESKDSSEQKYIMVDASGTKQPVVTAQLEPEIKGVVVVCDGADDIRVQTRVTSVVTTALGLSSAKVCVVKIDQ